MAVLTRKRRKPQLRTLNRAAVFGPAAGLPAWAWMALGEPLRWAGMTAMIAAGLAVIPALAVTALFIVPKLPALLVPRAWRRRYRQRGGRLRWDLRVSRPRERQRSSYISRFLRRVTFAADRHRCAYCRVRFAPCQLNCDHYVPWSQGGLTVLWNMVTLCRDCNVTKSNYWPGVHYRPLEGSDNLALAIAILAAERRHRWNPLRLTRAAWELGA